MVLAADSCLMSTSALASVDAGPGECQDCAGAKLDDPICCSDVFQVSVSAVGCRRLNKSRHMPAARLHGPFSTSPKQV